MWHHVFLTVGFKNDDERKPIKEDVHELHQLIEELKKYENDLDVDRIYVNAWKDV